MNPFPFRVHLHLGAHKTATTFIQTWLAQHTNWLHAQGIAYLPLQVLRRRFTPVFWELANGKVTDVGQAYQLLREILWADLAAAGVDLANTRLLVLSEENLLGVLGPLANRGVLYPGLAVRLAHLANLFDSCELETFLAIRNYKDFYPSAYAETLRNGMIKPLPQFLAKVAQAGNSWLTVVAEIESAFGSVRVWPYELFGDHVAEIFSALLQSPVSADRVGKRQLVRPSLSCKGLAVVMASREFLSNQELKKLVNVLIEKKIFEAPDGRIQIEDADLATQFDSQYQAELASLARYFMVKSDQGLQ